MFKKIEIWKLYLVILLGIPTTIIFGALATYELKGGTRLGKVPKFALFLSEIPKNIKNLLVNSLEVKDRFPLFDGFNGIPNKNESYLLLSRFDGDLSEGIV